MQIYGKEGLKKVERHRKMREGKGFFTIEQPTKIQDAIDKMTKEHNSERIVLLECMSNLAANEMFSIDMKKLAVRNLSPQGRTTSCSGEVA